MSVNGTYTNKGYINDDGKGYVICKTSAEIPMFFWNNFYFYFLIIYSSDTVHVQQFERKCFRKKWKNFIWSERKIIIPNRIWSVRTSKSWTSTNVSDASPWFFFNATKFLYWDRFFLFFFFHQEYRGDSSFIEKCIGNGYFRNAKCFQSFWIRDWYDWYNYFGFDCNLLRAFAGKLSLWTM